MSQVPDRRLASETWSWRLPVGHGFHDLDITVARDPGGHVVELMFVGRGRIGGAMDQMLMDMGVAVSRVIQGRDPATGEVL